MNEMEEELVFWRSQLEAMSGEVGVDVCSPSSFFI